MRRCSNPSRVADLGECEPEACFWRRFWRTSRSPRRLLKWWDYVRTPSKIDSNPAASQQVLVALGDDDADRGSGLSPHECVATMQAPAYSPTCQHLRRRCLCCSNPVRSGSHHLLFRFPSGPLGLGRSARCVLSRDLASADWEAIGPRGVGERPEPTRANSGGHGPPATTSTAKVAAQMWLPACELVASVARHSMRRSPLRRPSRAAPNRPASGPGTRPSLLALISP